MNRISIARNLIIAFSLTATCALAAAPGKVDTATGFLSRNKHNVGGAAGFISGYGLTYRQWIPQSNHGFQATFIPVATVDDYERMFNVSLGGMGLYSAHETKHSNLFGYYGAHYNGLYERNQWIVFNQRTEHNLFTGGGIGFELHFWNINYTLMFGYAAKNGWTEEYQTVESNFNSSYPDPNDFKWRWSLHMQPSIETALFYSF